MSDFITEAFNTLPDEARNAGIRHTEANKRLMQARKQVKLWTEELKRAEDDFSVSHTEYTAMMDRLDTKTMTLRADEKVVLQS